MGFFQGCFDFLLSQRFDIKIITVSEVFSFGEDSISLLWTLGISRCSHSFYPSFRSMNRMSAQTLVLCGWISPFFFGGCFLWRAVNTIIQGYSTKQVRKMKEIKKKWFMSEVYLQNTIFEKENCLWSNSFYGYRISVLFIPYSVEKGWKGRVLDDSFA